MNKVFFGLVCKTINTFVDSSRGLSQHTGNAVPGQGIVRLADKVIWALHLCNTGIN